MRMTKEEQILYKHFVDLIKLSYQRSIPYFTNFLSLNEIELAYQAAEEFYGKNAVKQMIKEYGGYPDAERKIIAFIPEQSYEKEDSINFPICCIKITPLNKRYCDELNHRDYLGTIMNLGMNRDQIGDILVKKDEVFDARVGFIFCKKDKKDLLLDINRIKHTTVKTEAIASEDIEWNVDFKEIKGSVSSFRLDAILSLALKLSRSKSIVEIQSGNVFLNGRICTENAKCLKEGDIFSVRGYGKYVFEKTNDVSKKGRYYIKVKKYI